jgi:cold shock CspA family protein
MINTNRLKGKVLWFDQREGYGIIKATLGSKFKRVVEFYVDSSVIESSIKSGDSVTFEHNEAIRDCVCAYKVKVA